MTSESERGSATILVLGLVAVGTILIAGLGLLIGAQISRGAAQSAADLAALAAAHAAQDGFVADRPVAAGSVMASSAPCAVASAVVERNRAQLEFCSVGPGGVVDVAAKRTARLGRMQVGQASASARAGPVWMRELLTNP